MAPRNDVPHHPITGLQLQRRQTQHSDIAKSAIMSHFSSGHGSYDPEDEQSADSESSIRDPGLMPPQHHIIRRTSAGGSKAGPLHPVSRGIKSGASLTDTPMPSAPSSPQM